MEKFSEEYVVFLAEKKECYEEYKAVRKEMLNYQTAQNNVDKILGLVVSRQDERRIKDLL